jgi:hypothetical protein
MITAIGRAVIMREWSPVIMREWSPVIMREWSPVIMREWSRCGCCRPAALRC